MRPAFAVAAALLFLGVAMPIAVTGSASVPAPNPASTPAIPPTCLPKVPPAVGTALHLTLGGLPHALLGQDVHSPLLHLDDGLGETVQPSGHYLVSGLVDGNPAAPFFLSLTSNGLHGRIRTLQADGTILDHRALAAPGAALLGDAADQWCGHVTASPGSGGASSAAAGGITTVSTVRVFLLANSLWYSAHFSACWSCVAQDLFNDMRSNYATASGQGFSLYALGAGTSATGDDAYGIRRTTGPVDLSKLATFANKMSTRTDKSSWDASYLLDGYTSDPGNGGIAYIGGRFAIVLTDSAYYSGHAMHSGIWYEELAAAMTHEVGHNFGGRHTSDIGQADSYWTKKNTCYGDYDPATYRCVGGSTNCQGTTIPLLYDENGYPYCIGSSPPVNDKKHYRIMAGGYVNYGTKTYWDGGFDPGNVGKLNACLPNWHTMPYDSRDHCL